MKDVAIFGAGGLGREVAQLIRDINTERKIWNFIGYFDDAIQDSKQYLGNSEQLLNYNKPLYVVFALANPAVIKRIKNSLSSQQIKFPNLLHPEIHFKNSDVQMGVGNIITAFCHFTVNVKIGDFNVFNSRVIVGHDVKIGSYNVFNSNVTIAGKVSVGDGNFFGMNSSVIQGKKIGNQALIGASSLVLTNVNNGEKVFGNPAFKM